jgi:hypothetical protein
VECPSGFSDASPNNTADVESECAAFLLCQILGLFANVLEFEQTALFRFAKFVTSLQLVLNSIRNILMALYIPTVANTDAVMDMNSRTPTHGNATTIFEVDYIPVVLCFFIFHMMFSCCSCMLPCILPCASLIFPEEVVMSLLYVNNIFCHESVIVFHLALSLRSLRSPCPCQPPFPPVDSSTLV